MPDDGIVAWVENHVIGYFANRFHYPTTAFKWDTNVFKAFNFNASGWAELADRLNREDWMIQIHVLLAQREMGARKTIGDLTSLICDKYRAEKLFVAKISLDEATLESLSAHVKPSASKSKKAKKTKKKTKSGKKKNKPR